MNDRFVKDPAFRTSAGDPFETMLDPARHSARTVRFDEAIGRSHDHFWDPNSPAYLDFDAPFDVATQYVLPPGMFPEMASSALVNLDEPTRIALANENARWLLSGVLHGEQAAMSLCCGLAAVLVDPGTQEFISNQAREEARHVTAFARYIEARWGTPYPPGETLGALLRDLVGTSHVYRKFVGMQILVEGLAVGVFTAVQLNTADPVLKRLTQLVITDESFHHRFGKTWADSTIASLDTPEREQVEDWAADVFGMLVVNLADVEQKQAVYARFGFDWRTVRDGCGTTRADSWRRAGSVFRFLAKTLTNTGIITPRTRSRYARWLDMDDVEAEEDLLEFAGDLIAQQGIELLRSINLDRRSIGRTAPITGTA